jgi:hypothetical protein
VLRPKNTNAQQPSEKAITMIPSIHTRDDHGHKCHFLFEPPAD